MIGIDLSSVYVTACGQVMPSHASGRKHEAECQACQRAIAGESDPDENETPGDDALHCAFCDAWVPDVETAIESDWIPSYWDGDAESDDPVCPTCQAAKLRVDEESGEWVLIESDSLDNPADHA